MIDISVTLIQDVLRHCVGVPKHIVKDAISEGLRRFCIESQLWEETQRLDAQNETVIVYPNDPQHTAIAGVVKVTHVNGYGEIPALYKGGKLVFNRPINGDIMATFAICNNKMADETLCPSWLYQQHSEAVINYAVYYIKTQQGTPWLDQPGAGFHFAEYRNALGEARQMTSSDVVTMNPWV
ncbi:hypothetical protein [Photobacterium damselae]|uniref:hypothetical protein n=1 Tax=Photobacterium damselae TaxID=38293 RepID=UPI001F3B9FAC|nr:hypothetical protein [Photobacterium damselae]UKA12931.1 hypothetical protein IHC91_21335 [Photobacterium damselae subsp. damselae]